MKKTIYADNAATTKLDECAFNAMLPYLQEEYGNCSQPYSFSKNSKQAIRKARAIIALCINADPDEIIFTSGGSESDSQAIKSIIWQQGGRNKTITSEIEHHAVLNSCKAIERLGYTVAYLPVDRYGIIVEQELKNQLDDKTYMLSIMLANNEVGTIEPIKNYTKIAHSVGALVHTDAVQAIGHIKVDVKDLDVDLLSASAHKFNGPKGIGFLYVKKGTSISALIDGGMQEFGKRAGTENVAAIVAMAEALKNNCDRINEHQFYLSRLENILIEDLKKYDIQFIRNGATSHIPGSINLSFKGIEGETLLHRLDLMGISVSTGSACDSVNTQLSHVIKAINVEKDYAFGTIRISLGKYNTEDEVHSIADALKKVLKGYACIYSA
jgi:cysteine desulfurase